MTNTHLTFWLQYCPLPILSHTEGKMIFWKSWCQDSLSIKEWVPDPVQAGEVWQREARNLEEVIASFEKFFALPELRCLPSCSQRKCGFEPETWKSKARKTAGYRSPEPLDEVSFPTWSAYELPWLLVVLNFRCSKLWNKYGLYSNLNRLYNTELHI